MSVIVCNIFKRKKEIVWTFSFQTMCFFFVLFLTKVSFLKRSHSIGYHKTGHINTFNMHTNSNYLHTSAFTVFQRIHFLFLVSANSKFMAFLSTNSNWWATAGWLTARSSEHNRIKIIGVFATGIANVASLSIKNLNLWFVCIWSTTKENQKHRRWNA